MAAQARLRQTLAARVPKPRGPQATFQLPKQTAGAPTAPATPAGSLQDLETQFQELGGDVDALVRRLQLPPEVAAAAREYAATDEQHRDIDRIVGSLATVLPQ
jgi:hypothetical protein